MNRNPIVESTSDEQQSTTTTTTTTHNDKAKTPHQTSLKLNNENESTSQKEASNAKSQQRGNKRGRKPMSLEELIGKCKSNGGLESLGGGGGGETKRGKYSKRELVENDEKKVFLWFGNKLVEKNSDEYEKKRMKSRDAVKRSRMRAEQEQREREERARQLDEENKRMRERYVMLSSELTQLKELISKMPEHAVCHQIKAILHEHPASDWTPSFYFLYIL